MATSLYANKAHVILFATSQVIVACAPEKPEAIDKCGSIPPVSGVLSACYRLGKGQFRRVLWPTSPGHDFSIFVIAWKEDYQFQVPAPALFGAAGDVAEIRAATSRPDPHNVGFAIHNVSAVGGTKFNVRLPETDTPFTYQLHRDESGNEGLTFMNLAERVEQRGVFGYVVLPARRVLPSP